jgi:hypothetical protein
MRSPDSQEVPRGDASGGCCGWKAVPDVPDPDRDGNGRPHLRSGRPRPGYRPFQFPTSADGRQGLTLVHVRAQFEQFQETFIN